MCCAQKHAWMNLSKIGVASPWDADKSLCVHNSGTMKLDRIRHLPKKLLTSARSKRGDANCNWQLHQLLFFTLLYLLRILRTSSRWDAISRVFRHVIKINDLFWELFQEDKEACKIFHVVVVASWLIHDVAAMPYSRNFISHVSLLAWSSKFLNFPSIPICILKSRRINYHPQRNFLIWHILPFFKGAPLVGFLSHTLLFVFKKGEKLHRLSPWKLWRSVGSASSTAANCHAWRFEFFPFLPE